MDFHVLPTRTGSAAENMALDFLLLQRYPVPEAIRWRHYGWHRPSFTFGYSQRIAWVREQLPHSDVRLDLCRRPTGGGVVDHRDDWTYALVIPRGHPLEEVRAVESYRIVHAALTDALLAQQVPAELKRVTEPVDGAPAGGHGPGVCFQQPELYDVVRRGTTEKIAGAAQKRNKHGLLFQGSIWRPSASEVADWDRFGEDFVAHLGGALSAKPQATGWPELNEDEVSGLTENYSSSEWVELR